MPRAEQVSPKVLVFYGVGTLILVGVVTWILAELATPAGVSVVTADLSGLGRTVGLIAAAAVGVPAAVLAYHRQRALDTANGTAARQQETAASQHEHKVQADDREHRTGVERNLRERYTTCAEQLGHENSAIRLAGVYALASLADDWHTFGNNDERQVCIDLLCAYLRSDRTSPTKHSTAPGPRPASRPHVAGRKPLRLAPNPPRPPQVERQEKDVRSAIVSVIRDHTQRSGVARSWSGSRFNFTDANLFGANLPDANLTGANLARANLTGADLHGVNLHGANLHGANLVGAYLFGANLTGANLARADLARADLISGELSGANLPGANLVGAYLTSANLTAADLHGANLTGAKLTGANLTGAELSRANLHDANLTNANLHGADLSRADLSRATLSRANLISANVADIFYSSPPKNWPDSIPLPPSRDPQQET